MADQIDRLERKVDHLIDLFVRFVDHQTLEKDPERLVPFGDFDQ
jgi:hypothetical protein